MTPLVRFFKRIYSKIIYKQCATLGTNIYFGPNARCTNISNNKNNIQIGENSAIMGSIYAFKNAIINIGHHFYLGENSTIGAKEFIKIGNCVIISNDVKIYDNNNHPTSPDMRKNMSMSGFFNNYWSWEYAESKPVVIEDNVWIGQFSTILKGVIIGKGSIVGTRAVVTKNVPPYTIVAGNPAKIVKELTRNDL